MVCSWLVECWGGGGGVRVVFVAVYMYVDSADGVTAVGAAGGGGGGSGCCGGCEEESSIAAAASCCSYQHRLHVGV
jgi:hypothetical protein